MVKREYWKVLEGLWKAILYVVFDFEDLNLMHRFRDVYYILRLDSFFKSFEVELLMRGSVEI